MITTIVKAVLVSKKCRAPLAFSPVVPALRDRNSGQAGTLFKPATRAAVDHSKFIKVATKEK
jgi:hypothetical protein